MADDDFPPDKPFEQTEVVPPPRNIAGKYRLGRQIGEGGMGAVYEAEHLGLGARVAIKMLPENLAANTTFVRRFRREARAAAAVRHENVVAVTDTGEDDNEIPYIVMELLEGETLAATLRRERVLIPQAAAEVTAQMLRGLGAAHAQGVVHRDLKPGNIFLARQQDGTYRVKILDFGISKFSADISNLNVTVEGTIVGTPNFMAPEQVLGRHDVDPRADLYAVGVMLYRMITGKLPYAGNSSKEVYDKILQGTPLRPHQIRPDIPAALEAVVMGAMARSADDRFQTAEDFLDALRRAIPSLDTAVSRTSLPAIPEAAPAAAYPSSSVPPTATRTRAERPGSSTDRRDRRRPTQESMARSRDHRGDRGGAGWKWALFVVLVGLAAAAAFWAGQRFDLAGKQVSEDAVVTSNAFRYGVKRYASKEVVQAAHAPFIAYLSEQLDRPVEFVVLEAYADLAESLERGDVDLAALSAYAYVRAEMKEPKPQLLATAVIPGGSSYEGYIVTRTDTDVQTIDQLQGKVFCYVDPNSTSGYLYPRAIFRRMGMDPDTSFRATRFSGDHLSALKALHAGACDGAAVYQNILFEAESHGMSPDRFRTLATTDRIPYDAYCARPDMPKEEVDRLRGLLLNLKPGEESTQETLSRDGQLRGFVPAKDEDYESVRRIMDFLDADAQ